MVPTIHVPSDYIILDYVTACSEIIIELQIGQI